MCPKKGLGGISYLLKLLSPFFFKSMCQRGCLTKINYLVVQPHIQTRNWKFLLESRTNKEQNADMFINVVRIPFGPLARYFNCLLASSESSHLLASITISQLVSRIRRQKGAGYILLSPVCMRSQSHPVCTEVGHRCTHEGILVC